MNEPEEKILEKIQNLLDSGETERAIHVLKYCIIEDDLNILWYEEIIKIFY